MDVGISHSRSHVASIKTIFLKQAHSHTPYPQAFTPAK